MNMLRNITIFIYVVAFLSGCKSDGSPQNEAEGVIGNDFATGFTMQITSEGHKRLDISGEYFYLIPRAEDMPEDIPANKIIRTPVKRIICTSTSHIPLIDYLDAETALVGFPTPDYISSMDVRERIDAGLVTDIGIDQSVNIELIVTLEPDVVMGYSLGSGSNLEKISTLGIPVLLNNEFLEQHPLGRAEWIKVAGWLFQKEKEADSIFNQIKEKYLRLQSEVLEIRERPRVFSGVMYGDTWFLPGGKNNMSQLFADAGLDYLWGDDDSNGFLELSFESVLERAAEADLWIGTANFHSLEALRRSDERYTLFEAYEQGNVYTYDARKGPTGGSEYLELGYLRPDLILADLIHIGHPEMRTSDSLFFHAKLQE